MAELTKREFLQQFCLTRAGVYKAASDDLDQGSARIPAYRAFDDALHIWELIDKNS